MIYRNNVGFEDSDLEVESNSETAALSEPNTHPNNAKSRSISHNGTNNPSPTPRSTPSQAKIASKDNVTRQIVKTSDNNIPSFPLKNSRDNIPSYPIKNSRSNAPHNISESSDTTIDEGIKTAWQIEAERRAALRAGKYQDPENSALKTAECDDTKHQPRPKPRDRETRSFEKDNEKASHRRLDGDILGQAQHTSVISRRNHDTQEQSMHLSNTVNTNKPWEKDAESSHGTSTNNADESGKPAWQVEAERRQQARNGRYDDPEFTPRCAQPVPRPRRKSVGDLLDDVIEDKSKHVIDAGRGPLQNGHTDRMSEGLWQARNKQSVPQRSRRRSLDDILDSTESSAMSSQDITTPGRDYHAQNLSSLLQHITETSKRHSLPPGRQVPDKPPRTSLLSSKHVIKADPPLSPIVSPYQPPLITPHHPSLRDSPPPVVIPRRKDKIKRRTPPPPRPPHSPTRQLHSPPPPSHPTPQRRPLRPAPPSCDLPLHDSSPKRRPVRPDFTFDFNREDSQDSSFNDCEELLSEESLEPKVQPVDRGDEPQRRRVYSELHMSMEELSDRLEGIDSELVNMEDQGRVLEDKIRTESDDALDDTELMISWFDLISKKNDLVRQEADLMYRRRQQELEVLHEDLEHELRCLMQIPPIEKISSEVVRESELIVEIMEVVCLRNNIVDSIEEDRLRYLEEDEEIAQMMQIKGFSSADSELSPAVLSRMESLEPGCAAPCGGKNKSRDKLEVTEPGPPGGKTKSKKKLKILSSVKWPGR